METVACECGCGRQIPARLSNGKSRHYAKGHGRCGRVEATCAGCGKIFTIQRWRVEDFVSVACSRKCQHFVARKLVDLTCSFCGKTFQKKPFRAKAGNKFCSMPCFYEFRKASPNKKIDVTCQGCGTVFKVFPSKLKAGNTFYYCSVRCRAEFITGPNNPAYTGGLGHRINYGPNWRRQRRAARVRDRNVCQICRRRFKKKRKLHVHHIVPFYRFGGDWKQANRLSNLTCLCQKCHPKVETGRVLVQMWLFS
jgi:hypothetical protein